MFGYVPLPTADRWSTKIGKSFSQSERPRIFWAPQPGWRLFRKLQNTKTNAREETNDCTNELRRARLAVWRDRAGYERFGRHDDHVGARERHQRRIENGRSLECDP